MLEVASAMVSGPITESASTISGIVASLSVHSSGAPCGDDEGDEDEIGELPVDMPLEVDELEDSATAFPLPDDEDELGRTRGTELLAAITLLHSLASSFQKIIDD